MSYGRSLALSQDTFLRPPDEDEVDETSDAGLTRQKRQATVYDAVAGRLLSILMRR